MAKTVKQPGMTRKDKATNKTDKQSQAGDSPVITKGLGLRLSEWQELEDLAAELGLQSRHAMTAYAVRYFIKQYRAGEIEMQSRQTLPGL